MREHAAALFAIVALAAPIPQTRHRAPAKPAQKTAPKPAPLPCGDPIGFQVLLDRAGFSPGEIDGTIGANAKHALAALQATKKLQPTGEADCDTWRALGGDKAGALTTSYTITEDDVNGPFQKEIPKDLDKAAELPAMSYRTIEEQLGERFHVSPAALMKMNAGKALKAGTAITVPAVEPFDPDTKPHAPDAPLGDLTVQVTKSDSSARVTKSDGTIVFYAPVTTGSEHDPLPIGEWKALGVDWHPSFHYNPDLFWDAKPDQTRATIKPGPNNPVGVLWISLNKDTYGMHGTPEPGTIGHTESHGCVRMTNWDAVRLASFVKPGTPVLFRP